MDQHEAIIVAIAFSNNWHTSGMGVMENVDYKDIYNDSSIGDNG